MKTDIVLIVILVIFGVLAGDIFIRAMERAVLRQQDAVIDKLDESLKIQKDLQAKLNYRTGDVAKQMSRMNDRLMAIEKKLGI